jgi:hypothetical protein
MLTFLKASACLRTANIGCRRILQSKLFLQLQSIRHISPAIGRSRGIGCFLDSIVFIQIDLARCLGESLEGTPSLRQCQLGGRLSIDLSPALRLTLDGRPRGGDAV